MAKAETGRCRKKGAGRWAAGAEVDGSVATVAGVGMVVEVVDVVDVAGISEVGDTAGRGMTCSL
jgi:hypothetical protein